MAGPGGGPPRKSHTKSRKGCKTCKRRHIRCDETFPQCRNCTKHSCRCDYMDTAAAVAGDSPRSPRAPDLLMTPEIEIEIDTWRMTGNPPFPELQLSSRSYWYQFSTTELRLIHHIAGLSIDMHRRGYSNSTVWAQKMPIFLAIALSNRFVMSSILAFSASHLAWLTRSPETENLAYHYRGVALKGLHEAISAFSRENSDAILASSMLLSWQATEWRTWVSLQQGVSTVLNAMQPWWKDESELARFLESQRAFRSARTPSTPSYPGTMGQFQDEDLIRLDHASAVLQNILQRISHNQEHYQRIADLLTFVRRLRDDLPLQTPDQAFERLQTLRSWLFWLPPAMLRGGDTDLGALAVLSQFFGVALALEPLFPEIGGAYLGSMAVLPIEDIRRILLARKASHPYAPDVQLAVSLMELPCDIVAEYRSRVQWSARRSVDHYSPSPISPYLPLPSLQPPSATSTTSSGISTYTTSPIHSPASAPVSGSPYTRSTGFEPRRHSHQVYIASPTFPPDVTEDHRPSIPEYSKHQTVAQSPIYSPTYLPSMVGGGNGGQGITPGMGYHEQPAVTMAGGFVAPELCWT